jgi:hypothetical protein
MVCHLLVTYLLIGLQCPRRYLYYAIEEGEGLEDEVGSESDWRWFKNQEGLSYGRFVNLFKYHNLVLALSVRCLHWIL